MADSILLSAVKDTNKASEELANNTLIKTARESLRKTLDASSMSDEKRADKIIAFEIQLALGMADRMLGVASEAALAEEKLKAAKLETTIAEATLEKQWGLKLDENGKLVKTGDSGLIDKQIALTQKQIDGFDKDILQKIQKNMGEVVFGLASNGTATPEWLSDIIRLTVEMLTGGKIDVYQVNNPKYVEGAEGDDAEPQFITKVRLKDTEIPDGINHE